VKKFDQTAGGSRDKFPRLQFGFLFRAQFKSVFSKNEPKGVAFLEKVTGIFTPLHILQMECRP
jgi:hypothetical protein